nr:MAG TPA: hypothetical protein [Caudoviricetes sp.]
MVKLMQKFSLCSLEIIILNILLSIFLVFGVIRFLSYWRNRHKKIISCGIILLKRKVNGRNAVVAVR